MAWYWWVIIFLGLSFLTLFTHFLLLSIFSEEDLLIYMTLHDRGNRHKEIKN